MTSPPTSELDELIRSLGDDPRLVHVEHQPAREARFASLSSPLPVEVADRLGVEHLWAHQAAAIDLVRSGRSVVVATGTASGKSLCYQAPIAEAVTSGVRPATSLLMFPTKALAQDQLRSLTDLDVPGLVGATYDGDTGPEARTWARRHANVVLTNPEMLHHGILPHHDRWATFLKRLRYVVVDELHVLRGIFGSHVAHLLRRLRRVCDHYGADPTFVFSSATIGDPDRLARELCGLPVVAVTDDASPRGERVVVLWNPRALADDRPLESVGVGRTDAHETQLIAPERRSTSLLAAELVRRGHRTIVFCRSRKGTEVVAAEVRRRLPAHLASKVRPYRGGYLAAERRAIEAELFAGDLVGVVATSALELGVDIGGLDACVLDGFPGTIASLWQQAGRAGREAQPSVAVLVAGDDQLDQWLMTHPAEVFTRSLEPAVINPANPYVLEPHVACAAYELPLRRDDERWWPALLDDAVRQLVLDDRLLVRTLDRATSRAPARQPVAVWSGRGWPAHGVGLRTSGGDEIRIAEANGSLVGTVDHSRAFRLVHPGAIYLHQGRAWRVTDLDLEDRVALVEPSDGTETTQPRSETKIAILGEEAQRQVGRSRLALGRVCVESEVVGYRRLDVYTGELLGVEDLDLPATELTTRAFWYTIAPDLLAAAGVEVEDWPGALHAIEHAAIGLLPLFTICDRWDVGGVSSAWLADTGAPTIVVYDGYPGGAGIAELGFDAADNHLTATLDLLEGCPCTDGCPSCVQSPKCGNGNEPLDKAGAVSLLRELLGRRRAAAA
jgi:DEAD/DEAH box helicase domain-containing protein